MVEHFTEFPCFFLRKLGKRIQFVRFIFVGNEFLNNYQYSFFIGTKVSFFSRKIFKFNDMLIN